MFSTQISSPCYHDFFSIYHGFWHWNKSPRIQTTCSYAFVVIILIIVMLNLCYSMMSRAILILFCHASMLTLRNSSCALWLPQPWYYIVWSVHASCFLRTLHNTQAFHILSLCMGRYRKLWLCHNIIQLNEDDGWVREYVIFCFRTMELRSFIVHFQPESQLNCYQHLTFSSCRPHLLTLDNHHNISQSITMFCRTDIFLWNILIFNLTDEYFA